MRGTLFASFDMAAKEAEEARGIISAGVQHFLAIGEEHLPAGVERPHRVFRRTYCRSQRAVRKATYAFAFGANIANQNSRISHSLVEEKTQHTDEPICTAKGALAPSASS